MPKKTLPRALQSSNSNSFDSKFLCRGISEDLPYITTWLNELIRLTEEACTLRSTPSTHELIKALQRYDLVFRELIRNLTIYSDVLGRLLAKIWSGTVKLLDFMIKSYHRYFTLSNHFREVATKITRDELLEGASERKQEDDEQAKETILRARARNLQDKVDILLRRRKKLDKENVMLRSTIDMYINSREKESDMWEIIDNRVENNITKKPHALLQMTMQTKELLDDDLNLSDAPSAYRRRDCLKACRIQSDNLNEIKTNLLDLTSESTKEADRQCLLVGNMITLLQQNINALSVGKFGAGFEKKKKIKIATGTADAFVQVDEKHEFGVINDLNYTAREELEEHAPMAPAIVNIYGDSVPYQFRKVMNSYPKILRIPPAAWVCQKIFCIYFDKIRMASFNSHQEDTLAEFIHYYFKKIFEIDSIVDAQVALLIASCESYTKISPRVLLFSKQLGLANKEEAPPYDVKDTEFITSVINELVKLGELKPKAVKGKKKKDTVNIMPDILRANAISVTTTLISRFNQKHTNDCVTRLKSIHHTHKGSRYIDVDQFLMIIFDAWKNIRACWEEHAKYLFNENCGTFTVLSELQYANDQGGTEFDAVLMEVDKKRSSDCPRRPMRIIRKSDLEVGNDDQDDENETKKKEESKIDHNKDPVCELITRKRFYNIVKMINPACHDDEIELTYLYACRLSQIGCLRSLERLWIHYPVSALNDESSILSYGGRNSMPSFILKDDKKKKYLFDYFYVNTDTMATQWIAPYKTKTIECQDIELNTFIAALIHKNIFTNCPFVEKLDLNPKDVWQYNAANFWKKSERFKELQILEEQAAIEEKMRVAQEIREREEREMEWKLEEEARLKKIEEAEAKRQERLRLKELADEIVVDEDDGFELDKDDDDDDDSNAGGSTLVGSLSMDLEDLKFVPDDNELVSALTQFL